MLAELLLERYGILTREQVLAEGVPGGFSILYDALCDLETLGVCRRGYFVEGLGGAQFALPGAVERLRAQRAPDDPSGGEESPPIVLAATDPAQPYGAALKWPARASEDEPGASARRPQRVAGAYVVLAGAEPVLYVERGGRGLQMLAGDDPRIEAALDALARFVTEGPTRAAPAGRAGRRRAGRRLPVGDAARRGRLPPGSAPADAERLGTPAAQTVDGPSDGRHGAEAPGGAQLGVGAP